MKLEGVGLFQGRSRALSRPTENTDLLISKRILRRQTVRFVLNVCYFGPIPFSPRTTCPLVNGFSSLIYEFMFPELDMFCSVNSQAYFRSRFVKFPFSSSFLRGPIPYRRGRTLRPRRIALIYVEVPETSRHRIRRAWTSTVAVGRYTWLVPWRHPDVQARSYPCWSSCWSCWGSQGSHCTSSSVRKSSFILFYLLLMLLIILSSIKWENYSVFERHFTIITYSFREYFLFYDLDSVLNTRKSIKSCCTFLCNFSQHELLFALPIIISTYYLV